MVKVPRLPIRLKTLVFREEFETNLENAMKDIDIIEKASNTLRNSENFKKLLKSALDLGNRLNQVK